MFQNDIIGIFVVLSFITATGAVYAAFLWWAFRVDPKDKE